VELLEWLLRIIGTDGDLEQVRSHHAWHHVGLEGEGGFAAGLDGRSTYDRLERSTPLQHPDLDVFDAEWSIADIPEGEGIGDLRTDGQPAQVYSFHWEIEPGTTREGLPL
jgi:hypothetical protein